MILLFVFFVGKSGVVAAMAAGMLFLAIDLYDAIAAAVLAG